MYSGDEIKYPKTLAPQATFRKAAAKKKAPKAGDMRHPAAMFEEGQRTGGKRRSTAPKGPDS